MRPRTPTPAGPSIPAPPRPMPPRCSTPWRRCRHAGRSDPGPGARRPAGGFSLQPPPTVAGNGNAAAPDARLASRPEPATVWGPVADLDYETASEITDPAQGNSPVCRAPAPSAGPYEPWRPATVAIGGAQPHPTPLVQSAAMATVAHPRPAYRPKLPLDLLAKGRLSDAQLESVILAGQAHERRLPAQVRIGEGWGNPPTRRRCCARQSCGRQIGGRQIGGRQIGGRQPRTH